MQLNAQHAKPGYIKNVWESVVRDDTMVVFFTLQTIEKAKCAVGVQLELARSIVNGLVH